MPPHLSFSDADGLRAALAAARHEADHDDLTGLLNRRGLRRRLAEREPAQTVAVAMLDLDGLKRINDTHGHGAGDEALVQAAGALRACLRPGDLLARWGGDEFVAVLCDTSSGREEGPPPAADALAARLKRRLDATLPPAQPVHLSLGLTVGPRADFDRLLDGADAGLRRRKGEAR